MCIRDRACPAGAIDLTQKPWEEELTVGALVVATGHQEFDARRKPPLGYGRYANVLTQSQLARLLSASGPTGGELRRPSDGQVPKRVFMLQCVGSRDSTSRGNEHCSAICCLFATLHASLIRESYPGTQAVSYTHLMAVTREKLRRLAAEKVDVCVHMCPNCTVQFDRHHDIIERTSDEEYPFVHLHVQQLVALALGADPDTVCGVAAHSQDLEPLLQRIGARQAAPL